MENKVFVSKVDRYDDGLIEAGLNDDVFKVIAPGNTVVLKPNWIRENHIEKHDEWEQVITNPAVFNAVIRKVIKALNGNGKIIITDGPDTSSDFQMILAHYPVEDWQNLCKKNNINLEIIDLRDDEWRIKDGVIIKRTKLPGDPKGKVVVNLAGDLSELEGKIKSKRGYYGADYNLRETNEAHNGIQNLYSVSRSVIECDVFINLPKLKSHKKAGITCCLKNLVGINTYKNYLAHYNEGGPHEGGDQFPTKNINSMIEGPVFAFLKQKVLQNVFFAKLFRPFKKHGAVIFGETTDTVRSGNWHGNDTIWRTILDLNKVLLYAESDGSLRADSWLNTKKYIGIVDGIIAGENNGPLSPEPVDMRYIIYGSNPVAVDSVSALLMGFDPMKIPSIRQAFHVKHYPVCNFGFDEIEIAIEGKEYSFKNFPVNYIKKCKPHFGWVGYIENTDIN
jgi:uncharacterized protein (DUF362 family)